MPGGGGWHSAFPGDRARPRKPPRSGRSRGFDVLTVPSGGGPRLPEWLAHPARQPVTLYQQLIQMACPPGYCVVCGNIIKHRYEEYFGPPECSECGADLTYPELVTPASVLDPFAGSGTSLHASWLEGRDSINFDFQGEYTQKMRRRLCWLQDGHPLPKRKSGRAG